MTLFKHILVPVDGSGHADKAAVVGAKLAKLVDARLTLLHVLIDTGADALPEELKEFARVEHLNVADADVFVVVADEILTRAERTAQNQGVKAVRTERTTGEAADEILRVAQDQDVDLIVMGRRGLGTVKELFLGSVSHQVAQKAQCACMTVV